MPMLPLRLSEQCRCLKVKLCNSCEKEMLRCIYLLGTLLRKKPDFIQLKSLMSALVHTQKKVFRVKSHFSALFNYYYLHFICRCTPLQNHRSHSRIIIFIQKEQFKSSRENSCIFSYRHIYCISQKKKTCNVSFYQYCAALPHMSPKVEFWVKD